MDEHTEPTRNAEDASARRILGFKVPTFVAGMVVLVMIGAGIGIWISEAITPDPFRVVGSVTIESADDWIWTGDGSKANPLCRGWGAYKTLVPGAPVIIYNADGHRVADGSIVPGLNWAYTLDPTYHSCDLAWDVENVPDGQGPYKYQVANLAPQSFTEEQARDGTFHLTVGG